ncbi:MAG TPA: hypothetical protein VGY48_00465 [Vicinamibacterales bacterium]|jgi:hypothetical protein|nr:hypothetical protein [Vicinamibacterales bacterium]
MKVGNALALTAGFVAAIALGVAIGPSLTDRARADRSPAVDAQPAVAGPAQPVAATSPQPRPKAKKTVAKTATISATRPDLYERLKPVLNRGANMSLAAEGFHDGAQFAAVAHAARNTDVPFVLLKHRVLKERQSLASAIRASRPDANAEREANRARMEAKSDVAALVG